MYATCFGIYNDSDIEKVVELLTTNGIEFKEAGALTLFEENEAKFRLTQMFKVVDENGNLAEITDGLILDVACAMGNGEYFDYDWLDELIARELEAQGLRLLCDDDGDYDDADLDVVKVGEKVMVSAGDNMELAEWLKQHAYPFEVIAIDKEEQKCWIKECPYAIPLDKVTVFQNIGF